MKTQQIYVARSQESWSRPKSCGEKNRVSACRSRQLHFSRSSCFLNQHVCICMCKVERTMGFTAVIDLPIHTKQRECSMKIFCTSNQSTAQQCRKWSRSRHHMKYDGEKFSASLCICRKISQQKDMNNKLTFQCIHGTHPGN